MIKNRRFTLISGMLIIVLLLQLNVTLADFVNKLDYLLLLLSQVIMICVI